MQQEKQEEVNSQASFSSFLFFFSFPRAKRERFLWLTEMVFRSSRLCIKPVNKHLQTEDVCR